jgi:hypothetical protein
MGPAVALVVRQWAGPEHTGGSAGIAAGRAVSGGGRVILRLWEEPDTYRPQHGLLIRTGRARIEVPLAFGTGEGDADRWSAGAGADTAGYIDGDQIWGFTVSLVRMIFASEKHPAGAGSRVDEVFSAEVSAYTHRLGKSA